MSFSQAEEEMLRTCDVRLQALARRVSNYITFRILKGHRGEKEQNEAFERGASKLRWPDGNHNSLPSRAIDVCPVYVDGGRKIDWKDVPAVARLAGFFEATAYAMGIKVRLGMDWDGDWRSAGYDPNEKFFDGYHIELVDP